MRNKRKFVVCLILLLSFFVSTFGIVSLTPALTIWAEEQELSAESDEVPSSEAKADATADKGKSDADESLNSEEKAAPKAEGKAADVIPASEGTPEADTEGLDSSKDAGNSDTQNTTQSDTQNTKPEDAKTGEASAEPKGDSESGTAQGLADKEPTEKESPDKELTEQGAVDQDLNEKESLEQDLNEQGSVEQNNQAGDNDIFDSNKTENNSESKTKDSADENTGDKNTVDTGSEALVTTAEEEQDLLPMAKNERGKREILSKESSRKIPQLLSKNENPAKEEANADSKQSAEEVTAKSLPVDEEVTADPLPEDNNDDKAIIIVSKNKDKTADWLKEDESKINNEKGNKPIFVDEKGQLYTLNKNNTDETRTQLSEKNFAGTYTDENGNVHKCRYEFSVTVDNVPLYRVVDADGKPLTDEEGNPVLQGADKNGYVRWNKQEGSAGAYELDVTDKNGEAQKLQLSYTNRLEDQVEDGKLEQTYYVGKDTDLNFTVQFTPAAGVDEEDTENLTGTAGITIELTGIKDPDSVNLSDLKFAQQEYSFTKKVDPETGAISLVLSDMPVSAKGLADVNLDIKGLSGALGDKVTMTVTTTRSLDINGEPEIKRNTVSREFVITESAFKDPQVKFDGVKDNDKKVYEHYAGPVDKDGTIDADYAETLVTELVLSQDPDSWYKKNGEKLEKINSLLRADKAAAQEIQDLTIVIDLPRDNQTGVYAQYDKTKFPQNLVWEEVTDPDGTVTHLRLQLKREEIKASDLKFVEKDGSLVLQLGDEELENASITNAVLSQGKEMVFVDGQGDSYKVNREYYQEVENSGWKLDVKTQKLTYVGPETGETKDPDFIKSYDIVDGKIKHNDKYYNLSLTQTQPGDASEAIYQAAFDEVGNPESAKRFQKVNDKLISYDNSFVVGLGTVVNNLQEIKNEEGNPVVDENNKPTYEEKANPVLDVALATAKGLYNIILQKEGEKFYGGTIYDHKVFTIKENGVTREFSDVNDEYVIQEGKVYRAGADGKAEGEALEGWSISENDKRLVYDQYG
ncbi:MAG: hypothetical protein Q4E09_06875, partial [Eubacteriales bacterium]|nr:hypothetical protein [Eubacteriales bacterium]